MLPIADFVVCISVVVVVILVLVVVVILPAVASGVGFEPRIQKTFFIVKMLKYWIRGSYTNYLKFLT